MRRSIASPMSTSSTQLARPASCDLGRAQPVEAALQASSSRPVCFGSSAASCRATPMRRRTSSGCVATSKPATVAAPAGRCEQRAEHPHGRGLAGAVRAEEAVDLAAFDVEVDAVDGLDVAEAARQIDRFDGRVPHGGHATRGVCRTYARQVLTSADAPSIAELYGLGNGAVLAGPVARGHQGQVWRLDSDAGSWAVKEPVATVSEAEVTNAATFQDAVGAAGVLVPAIRRTLDGSVFADLGSAQVRVHQWVDLLDPDPMLDPAQVGETIAAIHAVRLDGSGPVDPWYAEPVGVAAWDELLADLAGTGAPFAGEMAAARDEIVALEDLVLPHDELQLCHCDLFADNLRATADGRLCVIDWEDCGPADSSYELGVVLFEFARHDAVRARVLYQAYLAAGGPGRLERPSDFSMAIAQLNHIGEIGCRRWLAAEPGSEARSRNAARVAEFLGEPLTRRLIDEMLAAIRL